MMCAGVEQPFLRQSGKRTTTVIGTDHRLAERRLVKSLLDGAKRITALLDVLRSNKFLLIWSAEHDPGFERHCIPTGHKHRHDGLVTTGRDAQEINHRDPVFVCRSKPLVVGGVRGIPHKGVVDRVVAFENLAVDFPLIVVPDPSARAWKHSPDRKQVTHAPGLEYPALRIHEGDALTVEGEPGAQLFLREVIMHLAQEPDALEGGEAHQHVGVVGVHGDNFDLGVNA